VSFVRPSPLTLSVIADPRHYAAKAAMYGAAIGAAAAGSPRRAVIGAFVGASTVYAVNIWIWRPRGPGVRWYKRSARL
jgi:hypothetical protein